MVTSNNANASFSVDKIRNFLSEQNIPADVSSKFLTAFSGELENFIDFESLNKKLDLFYTFEKNYLMLIKEHKEEIKFVHSVQEDLRRERSNFFTQILKDASESLKKAEIDSKIASSWLQELVSCYTKSLNLSNEIVSTHSVDIIGELRAKKSEVFNTLNSKEKSNAVADD
ncbi:MAG: hypothetical protein ACP59X_05000 [Solidesulfovibrio sp. DCME]|uniref:hypothetical protein n=1 Tax=Solidesulfovibrio sp. DCME TaxID=3447380 RepID=UPI003D0EF656